MSEGALPEDIPVRAASVELVDGEGQPLKKSRRIDWKWIGLLAVRLALDAALVAIAWETWQSGSPSRLWVAGPVALYVALSIAALRLGARLAAPGIVTQTPAPIYVFLGILVGLTQEPAGLTAGVVALGHGMASVLAAASAFVVVLAAFRFASANGTHWSLRILFVVVGGYAAWALGLGAWRGTPYHDLLNGQSEWLRMPRALQGAYIGALWLTPLAFARELIVSMQTLKLTGHFRWMVIFALGFWIATNGM